MITAMIKNSGPTPLHRHAVPALLLRCVRNNVMMQPPGKTAEPHERMTQQNKNIGDDAEEEEATMVVVT
jgi:hypothetical protein